MRGERKNIHAPLEEEIKAVVLQPRNVDDKLAWNYNNGTATAKSFYNFLTSWNDAENEDTQQPSWRWIWKLPCPQKLRFFVWLIMHEKLPSNSYRTHIGVADGYAEHDEEVFEQKLFSVHKVWRQASMYAMDMQNMMNILPCSLFDPVNGHWSPLPTGYCKINVDGGFRDRQGTYGGVLRDEFGR